MTATARKTMGNLKCILCGTSNCLEHAEKLAVTEKKIIRSKGPADTDHKHGNIFEADAHLLKPYGVDNAHRPAGTLHSWLMRIKDCVNRQNLRKFTSRIGEEFSLIYSLTNCKTTLSVLTTVTSKKQKSRQAFYNPLPALNVLFWKSCSAAI